MYKFICILKKLFKSKCLFKAQSEFPCCEEPTAQPRIPKEKGWIFEGDSNVHLTNIEDWYGEFSNNHAWNNAISGSRIIDVIARLADVQAYRPTHAIIQIGGNDILFNFQSVEQIKENFRVLISKYRSLCNHVYMVSLPAVAKDLVNPLTRLPYNYYFSTFNTQLKEICEAECVQYIDIFTPLYIAGDKKTRKYGDPIHYDNRGRKIVADTIKGAIKK